MKTIIFYMDFQTYLILGTKIKRRKSKIKVLMLIFRAKKRL